MDDAAREAAHEAIGRHLIALVERVTAQLGRAPLVGVYAATPAEASARAFEAHWLAAGRPLHWPLVDGAGLRFVSSTHDALAPGFRGILEPPADAPMLDPRQLEVLLVPGLGFTAEGWRIGQGGGFYDRLLAREGVDPVTIGVAYQIQVLPELPLDAHDRRVDHVVTEAGRVGGKSLA